jgi:hypothetical protein
LDKFIKIMERYKNYIIAGVVLLTFIIYYYYNSNMHQQLKGEYKVLEKQYTTKKELLNTLEIGRKKEKDSLDTVILAREEENQKLILRNKNLQDKIDGIKKRPFKVPTDIRTSTAYYNKEYRTEENTVVGNKVGLGLITSTAVITDLEEGKKCEEIISLKDEQLKGKDVQITNLEEDKKDLITKITSAEKTIEADKELQKSAEENIKNLEKQNSKLKTKSFLNKILMPVAAIAGALIGIQISK